MDLAQRVDRRRADKKQRHQAAKASGRAPNKAHGKYLLSGGMLICPTCNGHFEGVLSPWTDEGFYVLRHAQAQARHLHQRADAADGCC